MDNSDSQTNPKKKYNPADKLKSRLFDKGIGHSSMSSFKSPLATDYSNRILLVNLTSANSSKYSPKVIRKQVAGLPNQNIKTKDAKQRSVIQSQAKDRIKTTSNQKFSSKQSQFLQQISKQEKRGHKNQTSSNFYNRSQLYKDQIQQHTNCKTETAYSQQFRRTKQLVYKLSGKTQINCKDQKRSNSVSSQKKQELETSKDAEKNEILKNKHEEGERMTLQNYINRALRNEPDLEEFLYLVNSKNKQQQGGKEEEDPYELYIMEYDNNKQIEHKLNQKYYTVSKKGLCYYVNSKPVQFIELQEWITEKQNYQKIKNLNFFNRFRRWKTVKMWRKIVLRHRIEQCSKNLQQKLFFLNPIMRSCLFQVQQISLQLGKSLIILSGNQDDYSLQNFKSIQEKTKRKVSTIIQEYSKNSRSSVKKCFDENLKNLRSNMKQKEKQDQQDKLPTISSHINLKDSAFQALGFPPKMSYENRSKLRKIAGKFIRFSYLVDMVHTAGLAVYFENQLSIFIEKLEQSQSLQNLQVFMTREDSKNSNSSLEQNTKMFNVKLKLSQKQIADDQIQLVPFKPNTPDGIQSFNPLYHIKILGQGAQDQNQLRQYCKNICSLWLQHIPLFQDIYQQLNFQIKQSLNCLKYFERWSKHRDMQKFINILQEWDDVVSQSRQISENQNLDPIIIIANFEIFLNKIKAIIFKSQEVINKKIEAQFTEFLNIHWQQKRLDLNLFKNHKMQSPAQTVEYFLKYITSNLAQIQKKIPFRIRLGMFQINLSSVRVQLMKRAEDIYQQFKQILPEVVEERTTFMNNWLSKYNQVIQKQIQNIDDFVKKVKDIKEIQQTFELKKQLCTNLSSIYQIMQVYKLNPKKRGDFEKVTLKLKDQLEKQINTFEQNFQRQSQNYLREVNRNYLPSIVKDINKLNDLVKNEKYITVVKNQKARAEIAKQIQQLQKKYEDIDERNTKCLQYQLILNQCHGVDQQSLKQTKSATLKGEKVNTEEMPTHLQDLINIKESIDCLKIMWDRQETWTGLLNKYNGMPVKQVLQDKEELESVLKQIRVEINDRLKRTLGNNEVLEELDKKVQVFQKYMPIISGLSASLSDNHWDEVNELAHKSSNSVTIDLKKLDSLTFSDMVSSCIGQFKQQFQQIFVKASNEIKLQHQYNQLEKKWKSMVIRTRTQGKYQVINDDAEHAAVIQFIDHALDAISTIFANPYSVRLQIGTLTYESIMCVLQTYRKWISVQRKLVAFERICKVIDLKKITQGNLLQNAQKLYKAVCKILLTRNIQTNFNITKLMPVGNMNISEKFQQCEKMLTSLQNNIKTMLQQYRKNYQLFYQLDDGELLRVIMQTSGQQNCLNLPSIIDQLICHKFMQGVVKQLKVQGQRITGIITIDGQNVLKSPISLTTDIQTILDTIMDAVSDYCRRMIRACRSKSMDTSLFQIIDQFNVQFLIAISKVDFSNYTAISIQNSQDNAESLKEYLKILGKDTKNGIQKLKAKKFGNIYGYQTLILQNLIHQKCLQDMVSKNVTCANQYTWIKNLRFYWEQSTNSGDQITNINIKKMHINLRYGKEYIGSKTTVFIDGSGSGGAENGYEYENLDMIMSVVRNSDTYCYLGNVERLAGFVNCIAHHFEKIKCTKEMSTSFGNPIKSLLKSRKGTDCCYYIQDCHLLSHQAMTQLLSLFPDQSPLSASKNSKSASSVNIRQTIASVSSKKAIADMSSPLCISPHDSMSNSYNPVFLHMPRNQNNMFTINRQQYRNISLVVPNNQFLICYLYLMQETINYQISCKSQSLTLAGNKNVTMLKTSHKHTRSIRPDSSIPSLMGSQNKSAVSHNQTIMVLRKVFDVLAELEHTQNNGSMCVETFLQFVRNKVRKVLRGEQHSKQSINRKIQKLVSISQTQADLHQIIMELVLQYLSPIVQESHFAIIKQYIQSMYPKISVDQPISDTIHKNKVSVNILTGFKDCLAHYHKANQAQEPDTYFNVINLQEYSEEELYGKQLQSGLLYKLFYGKQACGNTQKKDTKKKRKIIINGMSQKLIKYLYSIIEENRPCPRPSSPAVESQPVSCQSSTNNIQIISTSFTHLKNNQNQQQNKNGCMLGALAPFIFDFEKINQYAGILETVLNKFHTSNTVAFIMSKKHNIINTDLEIEVHVDSLSQLIDPKVMTQFRITSAISKFEDYWKYLEHRIQLWLQEQIQKYAGVQNQQKKVLVKNCIHKFYYSAIKGLWKDLYKISDLSTTNQKSVSSIPVTTSQIMINSIRDFLNLLETLLPSIFSSFDTIISIKSQQLFQRTVIHACIYALSFVYRGTLEHNTDYIKMQSAIQKLQAQPWLCIPQNNRIKPDQYEISDNKNDFGFSSKPKKRFTFFDFFFDGVKLIPIQQFSKLIYNERVLERGQFYFSDQFIHYNLVAQRTLNSSKLGIMLQGVKNSGKTAFSNVYKSLHHSQTTHITIHAYNKTKHSVYQKIVKILSIKNLHTIWPKLNFEKGLVIVDDISMPDLNTSQKQIMRVAQITSSLSSMIKRRIILTPNNYKTYKLQNVNFIISATGDKLQKLQQLQDCTIKCSFVDPFSINDQGLTKIFTEVLKANVLDPEIQQKTLSKLIDIGFEFYYEILRKIQQANRQNKNGLSLNIFNLSTLKNMSMFASHLRFKQNNPSVNQISRFWAYLLKDTFQPYCNKYGIQLKSLDSYKKHTQQQSNNPPSQKSISDFIRQPVKNIMYSHLYIKQQVYGNGKQVEHIRDLKKLYNSINETIQDYNKTDKVRRYGYSFQFISLDQLFVKIVKISNLLISGDYAIFSRKGSEIGGLIRLVSYMQGFNYKEKSNTPQKKKQSTLTDLIKQTILQLTKVSSYLIFMKVDDSNIEQFLEFYDCDFEVQIAGSLQSGDLQSIQATGAFNFGINSNQYHLQGASSSKNSQLKNQSKTNSMVTSGNFKATGSSHNHSHTGSKDMTQNSLQSKNRPQSTSQQSMRVNKSTLRDINKMKKSIRIFYDFNSSKYLRYPQSHNHHIPSYILSQIYVDFFEEFPQQSIIRFSQEILGVNTTNEQQSNQVKQLIQVSKDKLGLMSQVYIAFREQLSLTSKQYEECIRLYWSFVGTFPQQIKLKMSKYESIIDMNTKLNAVITEFGDKMEATWEEKKILTMQISKLKSDQYSENNEFKEVDNSQNKNISDLQQMQSNLLLINAQLQQFTQKKLQCEKIVSFYKPSLTQMQRKYQMTKDLCQNNFTYMKICLVLIASYFTYLSKLPFAIRKMYLKKWFEVCPSLSNLEESKRMCSISELFCLIREEDMIINEQNEQFYENMTIILQSIKPVLIRDDRYLGRSWMKSFDTSFATVSEHSIDFYQRLKWYLANSNNILLQVTEQLTLNNSQTNFINSLIFMSQNTPNIVINDQQYPVSKQTKVYIVVAPHVTIPDQIMSQHLYVTYEQSQQTLIKTIQHQIMVASGAEKFNQFLQYKKKQLLVMNQCLSLQFSLANMVWHQFYGKPEEDQENQEHEQNADKKINQGGEQKKTKQQLLEHIQFLAKKGVIDKLQQFVDKYNAKMKLLDEIRDKISGMVLVSNYNEINNSQCKSKQLKSSGKLSLSAKSQKKMRRNSRSNSQSVPPLNQILNIIRKTYNLISRVSQHSDQQITSLQIYYETIKQALKQGLIIINLNQTVEPKKNAYNMGMFVLFVLRQWGIRLNREWYTIMGLGLAVILEQQIYGPSPPADQKQWKSDCYVELLQMFMNSLNSYYVNPGLNWSKQFLESQWASSSKILPRIISEFSQKCSKFSIQTIQTIIIDALNEYIDEQNNAEMIMVQNNIPTLSRNSLILNKKINKVDSNVIDMTNLFKHISEIYNVDQSWLLKYLVIFTGKINQTIFKEDFQNEMSINDRQTYRSWLVRKSVEKLVQTESANLVELKNNQNIENQVKKIMNEKQNIFVPVINGKSNSNGKNKSSLLLETLLNQLISKYASKNTSRRNSESKSNGRASKSSLNLSGMMTSSQLNRIDDKTNVFLNQSLSSAHSAHAGPKIYEGFKLYIYHHNVKEAANIIAKALDVNINVIYEKAFIKNISNQMIVNHGIFKNLKNKQSQKYVEDEEICPINAKNTVTNIGQPSHFKHFGPARTKKHITMIGEEEKDKQIKQKSDKNNCLTPSMRHLQQPSSSAPNQLEGSTPENSIPITMRTNKHLISSPAGGLHHSSLPTNTSPFANYLYEATNKIIAHIHKIILTKTGHIDFCQNYFNKWYISPHYFSGIEKISQNISVENELWGFNKSIVVLCRIFKNLAANSSALHVRDYVIRLMDKIINKLQHAKPTVSLTSTAKLKGLSTKIIQQGQNINESQMLKFLNILNQLLQQDSNLIDSQNSDQITLWSKLKQESEFIFFNTSWLNNFRIFLNQNSVEFKPDNDETDKIINQCTTNIICAEPVKNQQQNRASKMMKQSQINQLNKKSLNISTIVMKGIKSNQNYKQLQSSQEESEVGSNKRLSQIALFYLQKDFTNIKIKLNILKNHYTQINKELLLISSNQVGRKNYYMQNILYSKQLLNRGWLSNNWMSFIKESLPLQPCLLLSSSIQSLKEVKCNMQRQSLKFSKDNNYPIDLTSCSSPINFIKVFMANQFQHKTNQSNNQCEQHQDQSSHQTQQKKQQALFYYCITSSMTNEEIKNERFVKLRSISAVGWRLNGEGTYEVTQDDKITILNNVYITCKLKPQQMGVCEILLAESEEDKTQNIKIYSFTKKNQGQKIGCKPAYIK